MMLCNRTALPNRASFTRKAGGSSLVKAPRSLQTAALAKQQQAGCAEVNPALSLALAGALASTPLAAWADETAAAPVQAAAEAAAPVTDAAAEAAPSPTWLSYAVVLAPIVLYGLFNLYRDRVNPRAKFSDFLFIVAGVAVVANLVSIIGFRVRLF